MACVCGGPSVKVRKQLPDGSDGFRNLLEAFVFGTLQELRNIQKDDEAALQFADSSDVTGFAFRENRSRSLDIRRRYLEHFGSRVDDQSNQFVVQLNHENAVLFVGLNLRLAEA